MAAAGYPPHVQLFFCSPREAPVLHEDDEARAEPVVEREASLGEVRAQTFWGWARRPAWDDFGGRADLALCGSHAEGDACATVGHFAKLGKESS